MSIDETGKKQKQAIAKISALILERPRVGPRVKLLTDNFFLETSRAL